MDDSTFTPIKKKKVIKIGIDDIIIKNSKCGIEVAMKILCGKWNIELLNYCISNNESISNMRTIFTYIPRTTLTKKLTWLCEMGLLTEINEILYTTDMTKELLSIACKIDKVLNNDISTNLPLDVRYESLNKMIGQKWKSRILYLLLNFETVRFNEFSRILEGISHKILKFNEYINLFSEQGIKVLELCTVMDTQFMSFMET